MADGLYLGIDVGTGSARAGVFDAAGKLLGAGSHPIALHQPADDFVEQSSDDIWKACGLATRAALAEAGVPPHRIRGVGFDATCSLVALGADDRPVTVSPSGDDQWNVIVWMDHRAVEQAARINARGYEVLRYVGGVISPEMETPKLVWLKQHLPESFVRTARFFDLADFLSYRATGNDARSLCTTACKWTYLGHLAEERGSGWDAAYFAEVGLRELVDEGFARIGRSVKPMGELAGHLLPKAAEELGLMPGIAVAISIIDAHAGGLGLLGAPLDGVAPTEEAMEERVALIAGTSTCHMAVSRTPRFVPGVWGPYYSAMVPGLWLTEGGQSVTGALLDHVILSHARGPELVEQAKREGSSPQAILNRRLEAMAAESAAPFPAHLTRDLHVLADHHGNRSPRADPTLRGMVSGLALGGSVDSLALLYLATVQAIALGTRHILEALNAQGYRARYLFASGGLAKNPVFLREHADATGCSVVLPAEPEAMLLGAAILGAVASGDQPSVLAAMAAMNRVDRVIAPAGGEVGGYFDRKYAVYQRMHDDQLAYRGIMEAK